jgi:hypothetical protein
MNEDRVEMKFREIAEEISWLILQHDVDECVGLEMASSIVDRVRREHLQERIAERNKNSGAMSNARVDGWGQEIRDSSVIRPQDRRV